MEEVLKVRRGSDTDVRDDPDQARLQADRDESVHDHGVRDPATRRVAEWAARWDCDLLDPVPVPGLATAATWRGAVSGTTRAPGKNHPIAAAWLVDRYCPPGGVCVDPMIGTGGLWLRASRDRIGALYGCEVEESLYELGRGNVGGRGFRVSGVECSDARRWEPPAPADLVLFSPPFLQNHSSGATAHQQRIRERKSLHTMQQFGTSPDNLGRRRKGEFWVAMSEVYARVADYLGPGGRAVVILRNRIRQGVELDEVGRHIGLMRGAGLVPAGVHPRDLERPTGYQAWKVARDPRTPWVRHEWAVVATL